MHCGSDDIFNSGVIPVEVRLACEKVALRGKLFVAAVPDSFGVNKTAAAQIVGPDPYTGCEDFHGKDEMKNVFAAGQKG